MTEHSRTGSSALEINLRRTAAEVEIPAECQILLDATAQSVGVHQKTKALLQEVYHPFANWFAILQDLRAYSIGNFYHHNNYEKGDEAIAALISIFFLVETNAPNEALQQESMRTLIRYLEKVVEQSAEHLERNRPVVESAIGAIDGRCKETCPYAPLLSGPLRRLFGRIQATDEGWDTDLLHSVLVRHLKSSCDHWLSRPDPIEWVDPPPDESTSALFQLSHKNLEVARDAIHEPGISFDAMIEDTRRYPDHSTIERLYLDAAEQVGKRESGWRGYTGEVLFHLKIIDTPSLRRIRDASLRAINRSLSRALLLDDRPHADRFIDDVFNSFQKGEIQHDTTVLDCIHTIAEDVLRSGDEPLLRKVIDRMLEHGFETPDVRGVNELWQYEVNPAHVKNIRSWLDLIAQDPVRMKRLLAALVFHLRMGGVFVSDTDLFQKDIANLLNADIRSVYNLVKQLGKLMPVYFSEIGAEGKIRDVSTRMDELCKRRDELIHFLRKQCHVESSSRLIPFLEATLKYWATGDRGPLRTFLPAEVFEYISTDMDHFREMHQVFAELARREGRFPSDLLDEDMENVEKMINSVENTTDVAKEKARHAIELHQLLNRKYDLGSRGVVDEIERSRLVEHHSAALLGQALDEGNHLRALDHLIPLLEELKEIVIDPRKAESREDIYHKRHIAAGIPSMYGRFINGKLEALGLTFRLESLASAQFDQLMEAENLRYVTKRGIDRILHWLVLFQRSLEVDGISSRALAAQHDMLESGLRLGDLTLDQYINIFQFMSRTLREIIREQIINVYEVDMERMIPQYLDDPNDTEHEKAYILFEEFLRNQISTCFGLQSLDNLIEHILNTLQYESENFSKSTRNLLMSYDIDKCFAPIFGPDVPHKDPIFFGYKGFGLRRMADFHYPIPPGFIITTEVYRCYQALREFGELRDHGVEVMAGHLREVERQTGKRFGDLENPLLLSVRSGSAISMPGILDTFLNVGINEQIVESQAARPRFAWAAWDNYRRFLQCWGMSYGMQQDKFDQIFEDYKSRYSVTHKRYFSVEQIREIALACREAIHDSDVKLVDDPFEQLRYCIDRVIDSWDGDRANVYRREMHIAHDWGTAVVVQAMVYGNVDEKSGTGVVFTRNPRVRYGDISLYGDFVLQSQGEDVVRGLVETFPITEEQREIDGADVRMSLESAFPEIYSELFRISKELVEDHGLNHQEIEFTFENEQANALYILQARDVITPEQTVITTFVPTPELESSYLASGIGVGGGSVSGRVAHTEEDILEFRREDADVKIILIRPNTVPEDMHMIFLADGLLTCRGGCTSHAAVAAERVGRTCVVGCRKLQVDVKKKETRTGDQILRSGEFISINGFDGSVYLGEHEIKLTKRLSGI